MNLRTVIEYLLPPIYRRPRWLGLLVALAAPVASMWERGRSWHAAHSRRAGCDGSVIALTYLVREEFGVAITFADASGGSRRYMRQRGESLAGLYLGSWFVYGRAEVPNAGYDYLVHAPGTDAETRARIKSVIALYNSAGFTYDVIE